MNEISEECKVHTCMYTAADLLITSSASPLLLLLPPQSLRDQLETAQGKEAALQTECQQLLSSLHKQEERNSLLQSEVGSVKADLATAHSEASTSKMAAENVSTAALPSSSFSSLPHTHFQAGVHSHPSLSTECS